MRSYYIYPIAIYRIIYIIYDRSSSSKLGVPPKGMCIDLIKRVDLIYDSMARDTHTNIYLMFTHSIQQTVDLLHMNQLRGHCVFELMQHDSSVQSRSVVWVAHEMMQFVGCALAVLCDSL